MYVTRADADILCTDEVRELKRKYREKFGEQFNPFNYDDFPGTKTQRPGEMYKEALLKALQRDEPTRIESHRYDDFDH